MKDNNGRKHMYSPNYGKPVTKAAIGSNTTILNSEQIQEIEDKFVYYMLEFNFE